MSDDPMIGPGTHLAHYECIATLGRGGMGEVWRARDSKLGRDVAIKTLPDEFAQDAERLARLRREARLLAALNHPNIATIHSFEEDSPTRFLVMELIEGPTLDELISRGPIPVDEALRIGRQIAEALEAAHDRGIVHRDLKPANIKVAKSGHVKVLDFGIAKPLFAAARAAPDAPTVSPATVQGKMLGTPGYMSPEQIRGEEVDARTDIWAFGIILAEMLGGAPLIRAKTSADALASVLAPGEVALDLPAATPPLVARLIRHCLAKDRDQRLRHIGDARIDIQDSIDGVFELPNAAASRPARSRWYVGGIAAVAVAGGLTAGWFAPGLLPTDEAAEHYDIVTNGTPRGNPGFDTLLAISPDGRKVAYATLDAVFVYSIDDGTTTSIDKGMSPFFSADSRFVAYVINDTLLRAPIGGGAPSQIARTQSRFLGGSWGERMIVYATNDGLFGVPVDGSEPPRSLLSPNPERGELAFASPDLLPDDRGVVFVITPSDPTRRPELAVLDLETLAYERLEILGNRPRYSASGHLIFSRGGELTALRFDAQTLRVTGEATGLGYVTPFIQPSFDVSDTGTLVYTPPLPPPNISNVWVDPENGGEVDSGMAGSYTYPRVSPDGSRVVGDRVANGNRELYIWDFERRIETLLTGDPKEDLLGYFSPDGESVYFTSNRIDNRMKIFVAPTDRSREAELVFGPATGDDEFDYWLMDVLSDRMIVMKTIPGGAREFLAVGLAEPHASQSLVYLSNGGLNAIASPDERWLAYQSNETNRTEVWVRSIDRDTVVQAQVSRAGGYYPQWSPDGRSLYYFGFDGALMTVDMGDGSTLAPGPPREALPYRYARVRGSDESPVLSDSARTYDVAPDGRLLINKSTDVTVDLIRVTRGVTSQLD